MPVGVEPPRCAPTLPPAALPQVFVVADGGVDLEHFELRTFEEVRSILLQVGGEAHGGGFFWGGG